MKSHEKSLQTLLSLIETRPEFLKGAFVADKVVGKAAALLFAVSGVSAVYAAVVSASAVEVSERAGIPLVFGERTPRILNRTGDGVCPLEQCVADIDDPALVYKTLTAKIAELRGN